MKAVAWDLARMLFFCALVVIAGCVFFYDQVRARLSRCAAPALTKTDAMAVADYFEQQRLRLNEDLREWPGRAEPILNGSAKIRARAPKHTESLVSSTT